jgi:hypothetical protein
VYDPASATHARRHADSQPRRVDTTLLRGARGSLRASLWPIPAVLGRPQIRAYQLDLTNDQHLAPATIGVAVAALRFLYTVTLHKRWSVDVAIPRPSTPQTLPVVLSPGEVVQFLDAVKAPKHRTILTACYAAGLRISEAVRLTLQVRTLRCLGRPWQHGQSVLRQLAADAGVHRRVDVLLYEAISGPVSCGVARPTIVLPIEAQTWHEDDLGRAIVHELEHVRRGDFASQCLARAVCACYWFHPLVWIAWRRLGLENPS